ncbi:hypothetical protein GCM10007147_41750 [Nocardiopsis kunsanensis]|uniref:Uncharacterized protein n=1 Tax=Nocardiopsis kunsanensis TaxID=141693 RepID=A0A919CM78_9ACTN|nr:hypothetical protein GCM10007147_41750 [Nocardiopsis kunsanensis]
MKRGILSFTRESRCADVNMHGGDRFFSVRPGDVPASCTSWLSPETDPTSWENSTIPLGVVMCAMSTSGTTTSEVVSPLAGSPPSGEDARIRCPTSRPAPAGKGGHGDGPG